MKDQQDAFRASFLLRTFAKMWASVFDRASLPYQYALQARAGTDVLDTQVRVAFGAPPSVRLHSEAGVQQGDPLVPLLLLWFSSRRCKLPRPCSPQLFSTMCALLKTAGGSLSHLSDASCLSPLPARSLPCSPHLQCLERRLA